MNKMSICILTAMIFAVLMWAGSASSKTVKCKVVSVKGDNVLLDCGSKADQYEEGMVVKVKNAKRRKQIEGC